MLEGTIIRGMGGLYTVKCQTGEEFVLRCKKKFRKMNISPLVGDMIAFTPAYGDEHGWVEEIMPRKPCCVRPPVANAENLMIVIAPAPPPDLGLVDKLIVGALMQGMRPVLVVNKCDLDEGFFERIERAYHGAGVNPLCLSAAKNWGIDALKDEMRGKITCFAGQSGVGKSTLINTLLSFDLKTGEISERIQRGKHTTRHAELMEKDGLKVLDTPGFSLLDLEAEMDPVLLKEYYKEFEPYRGQCKFSVCYHEKEPGCRVLEAYKAGEISAERMERYHAMLKELKTKWRDRDG